jgi:integrase/recombinase XerD
MNVASDPDLRRLLDNFLEYLVVEKSLSVLTVRNYRHYLTRFLAWMEENTVPLAVSNIDVELTGRFRLFLANFQDKNGSLLGKATQTYHIIALRSFLRYMVIRRDLPVLNPDKIDLPKTESRVIEFLSADQLARLLNSPEISNEIGLRDKSYWSYFSAQGCAFPS